MIFYMYVCHCSGVTYCHWTGGSNPDFVYDDRAQRTENDIFNTWDDVVSSMGIE